MKQKPGIWCPWAEILCAPCHGPETNLGNLLSNFEDRCLPREKTEQEGSGTCDRCGEGVWVHRDIALEQSVVKAVRDLCHPRLNAAMNQTGGMCSAAGIALPKGRYVLVTADELTAKELEEEPGGFSIGLYDEEEAGDPLEYTQCKSIAEVIETLYRWEKIRPDLMLGSYNATADARRLALGLMKEVDVQDDESLGALLEDTLEDLEQDARGFESRGDTLALARFHALKHELTKLGEATDEA